MSLRPEPVGKIPAETARVARAAFPKGTLVTRLRDEFDTLYEDEDLRSLYAARGPPGLTPWRLALVTVFPFLEHLSRPPGRRRRARPHRLEIRARARADRPRLSLQRAHRVPRPPRRGRGRAPAAGHHAGALQGARPRQGPRQAAHRQHIRAGCRARSVLSRAGGRDTPRRPR